MQVFCRIYWHYEKLSYSATTQDHLQPYKGQKAIRKSSEKIQKESKPPYVTGQQSFRKGEIKFREEWAVAKQILEYPWSWRGQERGLGNEASERIVHGVGGTNVPRFPIGRWPSADSGRPGVAPRFTLPITSPTLLLDK